MQSEIKFYGINETLYYLKNYEKELFKEFQVKLKDAAKPLADVVAGEFPKSSPLSNWATSGKRVGKARMPPYKPTKNTVKAVSGGFVRKTAKGGQGILRIQQMDAGAAVYDSAGRGTYESKGSTFIDNLDGKHIPRIKTRSRVMYKTVRDNQHLIEEAVLKVVREVDGYTTKRINAQGTR